MWKFFIPNKDNEDDIRELRKLFPDHYYLNGKFRNDSGVYAVKTIEHIEYGDHEPSRNIEGTEYWHPSEENIKKIDIEEYEEPSDIKLLVELASGQRIKIIPAMGLPRKIFFGDLVNDKNAFKKEKVEIAGQYNTAFNYGKIAYDLIYLLHNNGEFKEEDMHLIGCLVNEGIKMSYNLPLDVLNDLIEATSNDSSALFHACMGYDYETLKKEVTS